MQANWEALAFMCLEHNHHASVCISIFLKGYSGPKKLSLPVENCETLTVCLE